MIERDFPNTKGTYVEVKPYLNAASDTLMYIVNNKSLGGWKIYSSDKRTPAILAEGDSGYFSIEDGSPAVAIWISQMGEDISRVKKAKDEELIFSKEEIGIYRSQWATSTQKIIDKDIEPIPFIPKGHWEESVFSTTIEYDAVNHMVGQWDQAAPYNECCPYFTSEPNTRSYAGCVALAGAQMLHYLHYRIGRPVNMYSVGYCNGNTNDYYYSYSNPNSSVWSNMNTSYTSYSNGTIPEAIMIGYVGIAVNMHYCDNIFGQFSWALPINLKTNLFEPMGISCSHGSYDEDIVRSSLLNEMPVIVSASNLVIPTDGSIHCFVIDGYRRTQIKTTHHFRYVYDKIPDTTFAPLPMPEEYDTYEYSAPIFAGIKINWGWWNQWTSGVNDGWYALTSNWTVTNNGITYDYNHYVKIIYDFALAD
ncbi:MAG: C10 family peptidase [Bacteroidaceae bacterium]|nr:C10 family peptidase [Bacteroidaceae bacterium]